MIKQTKYGWIDFSNLPKRTDGTIYWKRSAGCIIPFKYDDIISQCVINKVLDNKYLDIGIDDYVDSYVINYDHLSYGQLGYALKKLSTDFLFNIGDVINKSLLITSRYRENGRRKYDYICTEDGYVGSILEGDAKRGRGCPACSGLVVISGKTDIATTHPHIASLFWNEEDAHRYAAMSNKRADFKCPYCESKINAGIVNVTKFGLSCKKCGDGVSYPEKFVFNVLGQVFKLHLDSLNESSLKTHKKFDWSKNIYNDNPKLSGDKIYDFYISTYGGLLIETHGPQHYEYCLYHTRPKDKTLEEEQENDRIKYNIAIQNGIPHENYIVLDCSQSSIQHIKQSIMQSALPRLLDFTEDQIDWVECGRFATSSRVYEACCHWNNGIRDFKKIALLMKMHHETIKRYIRKGRELNIIKE
jgi:hypothetical protein